MNVEYALWGGGETNGNGNDSDEDGGDNTNKSVESNFLKFYNSLFTFNWGGGGGNGS